MCRRFQGVMGAGSPGATGVNPGSDSDSAQEHPASASLSSCLPKGNGIQGTLNSANTTQLCFYSSTLVLTTFLFLEILLRTPRPFQPPLRNYFMGPGGRKSLLPRWIFSSKLSSHFTAHWGFHSTSFPRGNSFP